LTGAIFPDTLQRVSNSGSTSQLPVHNWSLGPSNFTSLYRRRAGVKHSTCTAEDVDTSIMNASTSFCGVNRGEHASTGRDVRRAKMDISHHIDDARALFGALETSTSVLLYLLSTAYGVDGACASDADVCTYLRGSCNTFFEFCTYLPLFPHLTHSRPIITQEVEILGDA
jgi:hypothetical protein